MNTYKNLLFLPLLIGSAVFAQQKPNVLWVTIEDTSFQFIGCYGNTNARTPVIDKMAMTGATELSTNQWMDNLLENVMKSEGIHSILLLVWISGIMAVGRQLAAPIVHRLSPSGVLLTSAVVSGIGIWLVSHSNGLWSFGVAVIFAVGICYFPDGWCGMAWKKQVLT